MSLSTDPKPSTSPKRRTGDFSELDGPDRPTTRACFFDVSKADPVSLTSTLFSDADWHWPFHSPEGGIVARSEGYKSEDECRAAVALLQSNAASSAAR